MAGRLFCLVILSCFQLSLSRILLFWAVDSSERTQETVQANVEHVKNLGIEHDVILAHYRGSRRDWDQKWYREHVTKSLSGMGFKFHFLQKAYKAGDWEKRYEFVWALDSDIDLSKADLRQFLEMARQINSAIVGPTFVEKGGISLVQDGSGSVIRREGHSPKRHNSHHGHQLTGPNKIQVPNPGCDFRHTDFVELTAPLLKSAVLRSILVDCKHCIHDKSDWGLDMMWCKYLSERFGEQGCALVDKTPVVHLDWGLAPVSAEFYTALHAVQAKYGNYWSQHRVLDCKHQEAGLVENIAEETVQDTSTKRKSTKRVKKKTHRLSAPETVKKVGSADASRRENPNERDSQEEEQEEDGEEVPKELNDEGEVVDGGEENVDQDREEGQMLAARKPRERKAAQEQAETEEEEDSSMNKPQKAANKKTSEQQQTVSNASSEATQKIQPAKEAKTTVTDEDEEEAEEVDQEESSESSESSDSRVRSNVTSASSANTSNKQAVSNSSSEATQKVTDEDEEEAEEVDQEESSESSESSDSKIRSNVTNSQGSKSSEDESKQDESEPTSSEGIFKVKAKAPSESHHSNDAIFDDGAPQKTPGLPTHLDGKLAVLGTLAGPKEPAIQLSSTVDAKGHVEHFEAREAEHAPSHTANLEVSFKEAELRLRDDIKQLRELEEDLKLSTERKSEGVQADMATKRLERKHHKKRRAKTHKHSAIQKAVSLIDMEDKEKLEPDQTQDSPSLQIRALAAGARQVAMEVAEEVQNTVGTMSSEQLQSTRTAALQSVQAAITEQVETQELHLDKPNANRHEVSLARKIRELEAQVAWDQKQMEHEMEEELGLKNQLKHIEGELRARKIASNMAVKDPHAKTTHAQRTEEAGKVYKKKSQHRKSHGLKLANHRKQS